MKRQDILSAPATGTASATRFKGIRQSRHHLPTNTRSVLTPAALQVGKRINPPIPEKWPVSAGGVDQ